MSPRPNLLTTLTGEPQGFTEVSAATNKLREVLAERKCLLIIDDVWSENHLRPFTDGAPLTARLVTTRRDDILPKGTMRVPIDAMKEAEAVELLSQGLGQIGSTEKAGLRTLATERLGEWPVIIRLVNGFLSKEVERGAAAIDAIQQANDRLDRKKLTVFDRNDEKAREAAVEKTIRASVDYLVEEIGRDQDPKVYNGQRYDELAVFPEDVEIPIATIARLWGRVAEVDAIDARDLLKHLYSLALLQALDLKRGTVRLHDVMRKYLTQKQARDALKGMHRQFVEAYDAASGPDIEDAEERRYFYTWFPTHLHEAGEREVLDGLLLDPQWMQRKLDVLGAPLPLISDYQRLASNHISLHDLVGRTLRLTSGVLSRDPRQLLPQLHGRLIGVQEPEAPKFLDEARRCAPRPTILIRRPSLTPPGAEVARLEGHADWVMALCTLTDGRLASGGDDGTIRLWDLSTSVETARLEGHTSGVTALCMLPNGRLASGSRDRTIRLWDLEAGVAPLRLEDNSDLVAALCVLPDGRLAAGSHDNTIRLWDVTTGALVSRLEGHERLIAALCVLPDGRLASGSDDGTIRLWDLTTGTEIARLQGHTGGIATLCMLPDGRLASGGRDRTIRLWDVATRTETARLEVDAGWVLALCMLSDGRLASGDENKTIRLWDMGTGATSARLYGHGGCVSALCALPNGRLASGSYDNTIRLWNPGTESADFENHASVVCLSTLPNGSLAAGGGNRTIRLWDLATSAETLRFEGHAGWVSALCAVPHARLASAFSADSTIWLSDLSTGAVTAELEGHTEFITALCMLPDGRLASGSKDRTIRLWDLTSYAETGCFKGHIMEVSALCALPDGRLASGSMDNTIRLWDLRSGAETARLYGHAHGVAALCTLPDGRLASGSYDKTISLWDVSIGAATTRLQGHVGPVRGLAVMSDGRLASGSMDNTIRVWDLASDKQLCCLQVDGPILCLAALPENRVVAGDQVGRLHWLELVE